MRLETTPFETKLGNKTLYRDLASKRTQNGTIQTAYYSSIDAEIYFGDVYLDEVAQIQFQVQQNVMPLIGYNSYTYDTLAVGSRIISGSFAINFTKAGYLYEIMESLSDSIISAKSSTIKSNEHSVQDFDESQRLKINAQSNASLASMQNSLFSQRHSPLWNKTFDIVISYGDSVTTKSQYSTTLTLSGVQITGCQQQMTYDGNPVLEMYTFIANDMHITPDLSNQIAGGTQTQDILAKYEVNVPEFTGFEYNEEESTANYETITYGILKFKNQPVDGITVEKVLMESKSIGFNSTKEIPVGLGNLYTYTVPDDMKNAIRKYESDAKRDFKVKIYCQYKNKAGVSKSYDAGSFTVKVGTILHN